MSCGTKITSSFGDSYWEREELSRRLEREGEHRLARDVLRGECLGWSDLHRAESALDRQGLHRSFDYNEERCRCASDEDDY